MLSYSSTECHPPRVRTVDSLDNNLSITCVVLTNSGTEALKRVKKPLNVQDINLFPCVYGSQMINVMLYSSIFAFSLSYCLYLYSTESK